MNLGNDVLACVSVRVPYSGAWEALHTGREEGCLCTFFTVSPPPYHPACAQVSPGGCGPQA